MYVCINELCVYMCMCVCVYVYLCMYVCVCANLANHQRFAKLKPSKLVLTINNLSADLLIRQTFFHQMLEMSQFAKLFCYTVSIY